MSVASLLRQQGLRRAAGHPRVEAPEGMKGRRRLRATAGGGDQRGQGNAENWPKQGQEVVLEQQVKCDQSADVVFQW